MKFEIMPHSQSQQVSPPTGAPEHAAPAPAPAVVAAVDSSLKVETLFARAGHAAEIIRSQLPASLHHPVVSIVCGSGLGGLQHALQHTSTYPKVEITSDMIPYFPKSTVQGHDGKLVFGALKSATSKDREVPVVLLVGRTHYYEGYSMEAITFATRVFKRLNVDTMIVTNATGGLNPDYNVGDMVMMYDHISMPGMAGNSPLRGPNDNEFGTRFPAMSDAYDLDLRRRAYQAWQRIPRHGSTARLHEGLFWHLCGPSFETRAECRMLRMMGADTVGMSTVPEVIVARHCGMRVLAMSLVTNKSVLKPGLMGNDPNIQHLTREQLAAEEAKGSANHEEVLAAGQAAAKVMQTLIAEVVSGLDF